MPSTYSPSLKIELIGNGEQSGTWGQTTNNNMGTLIEQAIAGVEPITLTGNKTLTSFNGLSDEARNAVLVFNGSLASPANVIAPAVQKTYIITNNAGANVTVKTASGNGVVIGNGLSSLIYCDGNDFYTAVNVNNVIGDLSVSGNVTVSGGFVGIGNSNVSMATGNLAITSNSSIVDMSLNTGAFVPPTGTTAQRPSNLALGMSRWNTNTGAYEVWTGVEWKQLASGTYTIDYLVVAGGGGGSSGIISAFSGAGGGAGGLLFASSFGGITPGNSYTVTIGAGGAGGVSRNSGVQGSNSQFSTFATAIGGGQANSGNGGSGGGGASGFGLGTAGQGNNGNNGAGGGEAVYTGGGGGGAGGAGGQGTGGGFEFGPNPKFGGAGGLGLFYDLVGTSTAYAGGGGGATTDASGAPGSGGSGVGGNGGTNVGGSLSNGGNGTTNRGGGGGGGNIGGTGGSGVVIIRYASTTQRASGGTVTTYTAGSVTYWVHTFTSSGTFVA